MCECNQPITAPNFGLLLCSFEEMVQALSQEPATTEEMDALEKYCQKIQQVGHIQSLLIVVPTWTTKCGSRLCVLSTLCSYNLCTVCSERCSNL